MRRIVIVFTALLTVCPALGQDSNLDASLSKISAMVKALGQAEKNKDPKALDPILDNSLVYTDWDGTVMNKAEYMAFWYRQVAIPNTRKSRRSQRWFTGATQCRLESIG